MLDNFVMVVAMHSCGLTVRIAVSVLYVEEDFVPKFR